MHGIVLARSAEAGEEEIGNMHAGHWLVKQAKYTVTTLFEMSQIMQVQTSKLSPVGCHLLVTSLAFMLGAQMLSSCTKI